MRSLCRVSPSNQTAGSQRRKPGLPTRGPTEEGRESGTQTRDRGRKRKEDLLSSLWSETESWTRTLLLVSSMWSNLGSYRFGSLDEHRNDSPSSHLVSSPPLLSFSLIDLQTDNKKKKKKTDLIHRHSLSNTTHKTEDRRLKTED